jgi:hypothetical protein
MELATSNAPNSRIMATTQSIMIPRSRHANRA